MFEQTPPNLPFSKEPEDILEKVLPTPPSQGGPSASSSMPILGQQKTPPLPKESMIIETPHQGMKRLVFVLGIVLGLAVVGGTSWFFIRKMINKPAATTETVTPPIQEQVTPPVVETPTVPEPVAPPAPEPPVVQPPAPVISPDTDGDGLTDAAEAQIGTNPNLIDSDNDGLTDFEEVNIYRTNPLNPDSDGDKYLDGKEVRGGYDPNVAGK